MSQIQNGGHQPYLEMKVQRSSLQQVVWESGRAYDTVTELLREINVREKKVKSLATSKLGKDNNQIMLFWPKSKI